MMPALSLGFVAAGGVLARRALGLGLLATSCVVLAQSTGQQFEITRQTLNSGGGPASGTEFAVIGTIGQPVMTPHSATGAQFQLSGGFWARGIVPPPAGDALFLDGFESP